MYMCMYIYIYTVYIYTCIYIHTHIQNRCKPPRVLGIVGRMKDGQKVSGNTVTASPVPKVIVPDKKGSNSGDPDSL